ncbi:MAG: sarcinarray family MAST domain-containing protein [Candidatus Thermoplasmatota archaeon]|nr:sarcinarray family MAST domain-containing protein [Candidatus Thermoplasmatota archaeon]
MKRKVVCLGMTTLMLAMTIIPVANAGECEYGKVKAWARTLNENGEWGEWQNATVHETLKVHEPFQVKVKVTTKVDVPWLDIWLERVGTTEAYEVIEGPSSIGLRGKTILLENIQAGWSKTYEWTIRPTGNWTEGNAALNIRAQFSTMEDDKFVDFTIIAAYISPEEWQGGNNGNNNGNSANGDRDGSIPGFAGIELLTSLLIAVGMASIFRKRK